MNSESFEEGELNPATQSQRRMDVIVLFHFDVYDSRLFSKSKVNLMLSNSLYELVTCFLLRYFTLDMMVNVSVQSRI